MILGLMKLARQFEPYNPIIHLFPVVRVSKNDVFQTQRQILAFSMIFGGPDDEDVVEGYIRYLDHMLPILGRAL